jgi:WD40 repeat protein
LWNPIHGKPVGALIPPGAGFGGGVRAVAFSPNDGLLATAGADGMVRLWNPLTGQPVGVPIPVGTDRSLGVLAVAFSPHGNLLATADSAGTVRLWDVLPFEHPYMTLCGDVGPPTRQTWNRYAPGEPEPPICPDPVAGRR